MVANYLQQLDWRADSTLLREIIRMYQKARAVDDLVHFYESCAQVEVDEYLEYAKSAAALREALRYQQMSHAQVAKERISHLEHRIELITQFLHAKETEEENPTEAINTYTHLLSVPDIEESVRQGDIYAQIIQHYLTRKMPKQAFLRLKEMNARGIVVGPYLERELIENVCHANQCSPEDIGIYLDNTGHGGLGDDGNENSLSMTQDRLNATGSFSAAPEDYNQQEEDNWMEED